MPRGRTTGREGRTVVPLLAATALVAGCAVAGSGDDDPCRGVACSSAGRCVVIGRTPQCACDPGYHPVFLACVPDDPLDPCADVTCLDHGTCRAVAGAPTCDCDPGYEPHPESPLLCVAAAAPDADVSTETGAEADADGPLDESGADDGETEDGGREDRGTEDGEARPDEVGAEDAEAEAAPVCGDGVTEFPEECDDANDAAGDGCERDCRFSCHGGASCDDENGCTADTCEPGGTGALCRNEPLAGSPCDDGDPCTEGEACDAAGACAGGALVCACRTTADCAPHEDGDFCNGTLVCESGVCVVDPRTVVVCDPSGDTACRRNRCAPATGSCGMVAEPDGSPCDDALFCTAADSCAGGACTGAGTPCAVDPCVLGCDEEYDVCVVAAPGTICRTAFGPCDVVEACSGGPLPCPVDALAAAGSTCRDAAGACDVAEACDGISPDCPADGRAAAGTTCRSAITPCDETETCDGASTDCPPDASYPAGATGRCPPDGLSCTDEVCDGLGGCATALAGGWCLIDGACLADGAPNPADDCLSCRPAESATTWSVSPDGTPCDGGDPCVTGAACSGGTCTGGTGRVAPPPPAPLTPNGVLTGSTRVPASFRALRPRLRWTWASDGCGEPAYEIQVDDSCSTPGFGACAFPSPEAVDIGIATTFWWPAAELPAAGDPPVGRRYYWRVRACRGAECSAWSPVRYADVGRAPGDFNGDGWADLVVGAYQQNYPATNEGNAFVYLGSVAGIPTTPSVRLDCPGNQTSARFGFTAAWAGDVNADGFGDLAVGACLYDRPTLNEGNVFVYLGSVSGLPPTPSVTLDNPTGNSEGWFGCGLAGAGDVNGDGYADLAVGAYGQDNPEGNEGNAFVYLGSASGVATTPSVTLDNPADQASAWFGSSVASAGDVNGDGFADVVVGAYLQDSPALDEGNAFVYFGSASGVATTPSVTLDNPTNEAGGGFGYAVAGAGDVNGDGWADLVVGAYKQDRGTADEGNVFVYLGSASGIPTIPSITIDNPEGLGGAEFGCSVAAAGDLDADGYADVAVGARGWDRGTSDEGNAFVYRGGAGGIAATPAFVLDNPDGDASAYFGAATAGCGDVDADGYGDLAVGAYRQTTGSSSEGNVFVYLGAAAGVPTAPSVRLDNPDGEPSGYFGYAIASGTDRGD